MEGSIGSTVQHLLFDGDGLFVSGFDKIVETSMIASLTLKEHGMAAEAEEMRNRIYSCGSYAEALDIISEYVEIV